MGPAVRSIPRCYPVERVRWETTTLRAFAAAANNRNLFVSIAGAMITAHPGSIQLPKVLWRLSQIHRDAGAYELEQETLRTLAQRFPRHELGQKAQLELDRQA